MESIMPFPTIVKLLSPANSARLGFQDPIRACMVVNAYAMATGSDGSYGDYFIVNDRLICAHPDSKLLARNHVEAHVPSVREPA